ncbi:MAG: hypothetical protein ABMA00_19295 [Gemmatimonas sp.]
MQTLKGRCFVQAPLSFLAEVDRVLQPKAGKCRWLTIERKVRRVTGQHRGSVIAHWEKPHDMATGIWHAGQGKSPED